MRFFLTLCCSQESVPGPMHEGGVVATRLDRSSSYVFCIYIYNNIVDRYYLVLFAPMTFSFAPMSACSSGKPNFGLATQESQVRELGRLLFHEVCPSRLSVMVTTRLRITKIKLTPYAVL